MKRTKEKDTRNCDFCRNEGKKEKAIWKHYSQYACQLHKSKIRIDDGYMTEADYQSWWNL